MKSDKNIDLNNRFLYRLVNVWYFTFFILGLIVVFGALYFEFPDLVIDESQTTVLCYLGRTLPPISELHQYGIQISTYDKSLNDEGDTIIREICSKKSTGYAPPLTQKEVEENGLNEKESIFERIKDAWDSIVHPWEDINKENYHLILTYNRNFIEYSYTVITILGLFLAFYFFLNLIKETLLYIAFGKRVELNQIFKINIFK